jgi:hypothetical protein
LDAQKRYLNEMYEAGLSGIAAFYAHFVSQLNEPNLTPARYRQNFHQWENSFETQSDFSTYLRYLASCHGELDEGGVAAILNHEGAGAVVDLYETVVVAGKHLSENPTRVAQTYLKHVQPLAEKASDARLQTVLYALGRKAPIRIANLSSLNAYDHLLAGDPQMAYDDACGSLAAEEGDVTAMEIAATAVARGATPRSVPTPGTELIRLMTSVITRQSSANEDAQELVKMAMLYTGLPWSDGLLGFIERETSSNPLGTGPASARAIAVAGIVHPLHVLHSPSKVYRQRLVSALLEGGTASEGLAYAVAAADPSFSLFQLPQHIPADAIARLAASRKFEEGDYEGVLAALGSVSGTSDHYAIRLVSHSLLRLHRYEPLLQLVASAYVADRRIHEVLPITAIAASVDREVRLSLSHELAVPIFYDIYSSHIDSEYDSERVYTTEDFLLRHGVQRPSELDKIAEDFDRAQLIYFLRYVCIESVLDTHLAYSGSQSVRNERIAICKLLSRLDPGESDVYQVEIKDLLRKSMTQRRMREVEQSKIHIDLDGIRRTAETLRESFERYTALLRAGVRVETMVAIQKAIRNALGEDQLLIVKWSGGPEQDIVTAILRELRDLYVSSAEHGLDKYLSVRIRHQTLASQLRKPLEECYLITQLDKQTGRYKPNLYWFERLGIIDSPVAEELGEVFETFAREFDSLVSTLRDEWIQIRTDSTNKGMFDFRINDALGYDLAQSISAETTFETFVNTVLDHLGVVLDLNLQRIRNRIEHEVKNRVNTMFTVLSTEVEKFAYTVYITELAKAIRDSHTAMQYAIDRVINWFQRARAVANEPFALEDAIHISEQMVRTGIGFTASIQPTAGDSFELPGRRFNDYIDIMTTIFENVVRHSDQAYPVAEVTIAYLQSTIHIRVENTVSPSVPDGETRERLERIKSDLADGRFRVSVAREGGTGFYKIGKILDDFGSRKSLKFGFLNHGRFFVEFNTPLPEIGR